MITWKEIFKIIIAVVIGQAVGNLLFLVMVYNFVS